MYHDRIVKKVPGNLPPPSKREGQGYIEDLSSMQIFELEELLERQNKLLNNKLADKGGKIASFREKIEREIRTKNEIENAANLLSRLNIASEGKAAMSELEWTGKYSETRKVAKAVELDSDDEEDPLKILAQPTGSGVHKKKVVVLPPEESLIRPEDLEDPDDTPEGSLAVEHVRYIVEKTEKVRETRESFKPYKTTKSNVHDPAKELGRKRDKHWEITAATPPPSIHGTVKSLSIEESLSLQKEQKERLREIQTRHAYARLTEQMGSKMSDKIPNIVGSYRTTVEDSSTSDSEYEENEVHDEDDTDKGGTVVFTVKS